MAKTETLTLKVDSNIKSVTKDTDKMADSLEGVNKETKDSIGNFTLMGVSLNGVKAAFGKVIPMAKTMFGTIKAGLISSGIGIFLIAIGSLVQYFKDSEDGASKLKQITAALGVIFGNITDVVSNLGKILFDTFSNPKKAVKDLWGAIKTNLINRVTGLIDTFKAAGKVIEGVLNLNWDKVKEGAAEYGESLAQVATGVDDVFNKVGDGIKKTIDAVKELGEQTKKEVGQAIQLEKDRLALQKFERKAIVEKARTEKDMMELRLKARDFEKFSAEERLGFMREANKLAEEQLEKDLHVSREKLRFQIEENSYSKSNQQNLDDEAQRQADVFNLEKANFSERKRLKAEEQTIVKEIQANEKAANKEISDAKAKQDKKKIDDAKIVAAAEIKQAEKVAKAKEDLEILIEETKAKTIAMGFKTAQGLAKEGSAMAKAIGVAETIYNTQVAIMQAMKLPPPFNFIQAGLTGVMGATAVSKILSTNMGDSGGGGATPTAGAAPPAPQMMSGAFELTGGQEVEPTRAYVVSDDITASQNALAIIRRRATI
tara:strand:+ start:748 stop:2379 length:1632 start_codon:yes stop_codon:yes gene_type:complete